MSLCWEFDQKSKHVYVCHIIGHCDVDNPLVVVCDQVNLGRKSNRREKPSGPWKPSRAPLSYCFRDGSGLQNQKHPSHEVICPAGQNTLCSVEPHRGKIFFPPPLCDAFFHLYIRPCLQDLSFGPLNIPVMAWELGEEQQCCSCINSGCLTFSTSFLIKSSQL